MYSGPCNLNHMDYYRIAQASWTQIAGYIGKETVKSVTFSLLFHTSLQQAISLQR